MQVRTTRSSRAACLGLSGELDLSSADRLRKALLDICLGRDLVLVDLAAVTFLDSTVMGLLVAGAKRCAATGGQLLLTGAQGDPLRTLTIVGLEHLLLREDRVRDDLRDELWELQTQL